MIKEHFKSNKEAKDKWWYDTYHTNEPSITVFRDISYYVANEYLWYIQPKNSRRMCDVQSYFGGFGIAMRLALIMFEQEFR